MTWQCIQLLAVLLLAQEQSSEFRLICPELGCSCVERRVIVGLAKQALYG